MIPATPIPVHPALAIINRLLARIDALLKRVEKR